MLVIKWTVQDDKLAYVNDCYGYKLMANIIPEAIPEEYNWRIYEKHTDHPSPSVGFTIPIPNAGPWLVEIGVKPYKRLCLPLQKH